jgi:hypothetical protein
MNTAIASMTVVGWGLVAYWSAAVAARRGRSFWPWFVGGLFGGLILLIAAGVMKPKATDRHFSLVVPTVAGIVGLLLLGGVVVEGVVNDRPTPFSSTYAEQVAANPDAYDNWCDSDGDGTDDTFLNPDGTCPAEPRHDPAGPQPQFKDDSLTPEQKAAEWKRQGRCEGQSGSLIPGTNQACP